MSEDDFIYWQDVLESVQAGRTANLKCPFCYEGNVTVTQQERVTHVECQNKGCRRFIDGRFSSADLAE